MVKMYLSLLSLDCVSIVRNIILAIITGLLSQHYTASFDSLHLKFFTKAVVPAVLILS